ncbi:hypothetical protein VQ7734_05048 [Vibrio quintilis]|uniref:Uncharacterized protein n=1 Tax=Vibrio quintilis TaxID=1117707 RepID=A0A1M7Z2T4_9VIBR|nr:hypothetical protein VQ7734_05048 [Vibrio quintilis]
MFRYVQYELNMPVNHIQPGRCLRLFFIKRVSHEK